MDKGIWSGYTVQSTAAYPTTFVKGSWQVPTIQCNPSDNSSVLIWVGLGGHLSNSVEQIGTREDCVGAIATYYVWYEQYPFQPRTMVINNFTLDPGDSVSASIYFSNSSKAFTFNFNDTSTNKHIQFSKSFPIYSTDSAEWIVESPGYDASRFVMPDFGSVSFQNNFADIGRHNGTIISFANQPFSTIYYEVYACGNQTRTQPTPLTTNGSFKVDWESGEAC